MSPAVAPQHTMSNVHENHNEHHNRDADPVSPPPVLVLAIFFLRSLLLCVFVCLSRVCLCKKAVGVSNYGTDAVREAHAALKARGVQLGSNQVQFSLASR